MSPEGERDRREFSFNGWTPREKEAAYVEKMNEGIAKGTAWERITEMIGLENSREWSDLRFTNTGTGIRMSRALLS